MNNNTIPAASTVISEADMLVALRNRAAEYGIDGLQLKLSTADLYTSVAFVEGQSVCGIGKSLDEAVTDLRKKIKTPAQVATEKREQARKLFAEAEALSPIE